MKHVYYICTGLGDIPQPERSELVKHIINETVNYSKETTYTKSWTHEPTHGGQWCNYGCLVYNGKTYSFSLYNFFFEDLSSMRAEVFET